MGWIVTFHVLVEIERVFFDLFANNLFSLYLSLRKKEGLVKIVYLKVDKSLSFLLDFEFQLFSLLLNGLFLLMDRFKILNEDLEFLDVFLQENIFKFWFQEQFLHTGLFHRSQHLLSLFKEGLLISTLLFSLLESPAPGLPLSLGVEWNVFPPSLLRASIFKIAGD